MIIKLTPIDTLFFRNGKSFNIKEDNWAEGIFPPYPLTIYGALRAEYFSNNLIDFPKRETEEDPSLKLKINGIFLSMDNQVYAPLPSDIVMFKGSAQPTLQKLELISLSKYSNFLSSYDYPYILKAKEEVENIGDGWIKIKDLITYLKNDEISNEWEIESKELNKGNKSKDFTIIRLSNHMLNESKIGIRISNKTGTTMEHYLYSLNRKRLKDINILVNFEDLNIPKNGILKLGGRNGNVYFKKLENEDSEYKQISNFTKQKELIWKKCANNARKETDSFIKIYFETPTIFQDFSKPNFQKHLQAKFKIIACALKKPINIGGFNMKKGNPRPMFKALDSGSIYYLEINNSQLTKMILNTNLSDQWKKRGFGVFSIGQIKKL